MFPPRPGWGLGRRLSRKQGEPRTRRSCTRRAVASNSESGARRGATPLRTRSGESGRVWTPAGLGAESAGQEGGSPAAPTLATRATPGHLPPCLARSQGRAPPLPPLVPLGSGAATSRASVGPARQPAGSPAAARGAGSAWRWGLREAGRPGGGVGRCPAAGTWSSPLALPYPGRPGQAGRPWELSVFWQVSGPERDKCTWLPGQFAKAGAGHLVSSRCLHTGRQRKPRAVQSWCSPSPPWCLFRARNGSERALAKVKAARGRCQPMMLGAFEHMKDWKIEEEEEENFPSRLQPL